MILNSYINTVLLFMFGFHMTRSNDVNLLIKLFSMLSIPSYAK